RKRGRSAQWQIEKRARSSSASRSTVVSVDVTAARGSRHQQPSGGEVASDFKKQKSPTWWALRLHKPEDSIMFQQISPGRPEDLIRRAGSGLLGAAILLAFGAISPG